jgi:hypothetical protein
MKRRQRSLEYVTFYRLSDAERAAKVLRAKKVAVEVVPVVCIICPGMVRKRAWILSVPGVEGRRAFRLLDEAGYSRFLY